jgi:hypothetical protein
MGIIPKLLALGLAATLSSPIQQRQTGYSIGDTDAQRINQLWLVTHLDETGLEVIAQAKLTNGEYAPMIAADLARLESMVPAARELARTHRIKLRPIKLINRVDIQDIAP